MQHRREIEGLRALAVLPVVLFHAGVPGFGGGFAGVDVFFVISGYLIAGVILSGLGEGRFSLAGFYERRARRILPALIPVLLASAAMAWAVMIPEDFRKFAQGLGSSAVFASNMLFARATGYFDDDEGYQPLLHTWSLSVEEQFYILFPALVLLLWRFGRGRMAVWFGTIGAVSLVACLALSEHHQALAFYLLPTRAWELLVGAACVALPERGKSGALAAIGLALVVGGMGLVDAETAPDWRLLLPVTGAALLLRHAGQQDPVGGLLSLRPLVAIGGASYGIYLWHNPLLAVLHYQWLGQPPIWLVIGVIAVSVALGFASLHLIERPVREQRMLASRKSLVAFCIAGLAIALGLGVAGHLRRLEPASATERDALQAFPAALPEPTEHLPAGAPIRYVLFGDSHARQYFDALTAHSGEGAMLTQAGCFSFPGVTSYSYASKKSADCIGAHAELTKLVRERGIATVIVAQRWERLLFQPPDFRQLGATSSAGWPRLEAALDRLRSSLPKNTRIVLIGNVPTAAAAGPEMEGGYPRCLAYLNTHCPTRFPIKRAEGYRINPLLARYAASRRDVTFFDPQGVLCGSRDCAIIRQGTALYVDNTHLTRLAADIVIARMLERIGPI
ncbi:acyltransferase family protein [Novosphingobium jiangmenense]|uniref:Acyltransferase n=1 Tax=Novosphingobium jiangmenense TaxID=2791981 RepID=A0ABS0HKE2_9SPHN|nr:acyltransferase family protein [Novosphingobium jiangmenense]MBF9152726.1 acyltransferase [Novosphingobium jiangmenense]